MATTTDSTRPTIQTVCIYRAAGQWCYAARDVDGHDHSDTLDATTGAEARAEVAAMFPGAAIRRVADVTADGDVEG